jgi:hypothetical protein
LIPPQFVQSDKDGFSLEAQKRGRFTQALNTNLVNNHDGGKFEEELTEIEVVSRVEVEGAWCRQRLILIGRKFHELSGLDLWRGNGLTQKGKSWRVRIF